MQDFIEVGVQTGSHLQIFTFYYYSYSSELSSKFSRGVLQSFRVQPTVKELNKSLPPPTLFTALVAHVVYELCGL
jgi:hypothetical protein